MSSVQCVCNRLLTMRKEAAVQTILLYSDSKLGF